MIKAFKGKYNYMIHIQNSLNNSIYEMSSNANQPNGVDIYLGELSQLNEAIICQKDNEIQLGDLPKGTLIAIIHKLEEEIGYFEKSRKLHLATIERQKKMK